MIPITHGQPYLGLVRECVLYKSQRNDSWVGFLNHPEDRCIWRLVAWQVEPKDPEVWVLALACNEESPRPICTMEPMRTRDGTLFLKGHWGLKKFLIAENPRGVPGEATLYTAVKVPVGSMPSICYFPDVAA
jgi:hypothetical protein